MPTIEISGGNIYMHEREGVHAYAYNDTMENLLAALREALEKVHEEELKTIDRLCGK